MNPFFFFRFFQADFERGLKDVLLRSPLFHKIARSTAENAKVIKQSGQQFMKSNPAQGGAGQFAKSNPEIVKHVQGGFDQLKQGLNRIDAAKVGSKAVNQFSKMAKKTLWRKFMGRR